MVQYSSLFQIHLKQKSVTETQLNINQMNSFICSVNRVHFEAWLCKLNSSLNVQESEQGHWHIPVSSIQRMKGEISWLCVTRDMTTPKSSSQKQKGRYPEFLAIGSLSKFHSPGRFGICRMSRDKHRLRTSNRFLSFNN